MTRRKTVEEIITAKMEQRLTVGGLRNEEEDLLDELLGEDYRICPLLEATGASSDLRREGTSGGHRRKPLDAASFPPTTNRGVSKHGTELQDKKTFDFGGFDGGVEVGFEVRWDDNKFTDLKRILQVAKDLASESSTCSELAEVGGEVVSVDASGARAGLHYHFKFTLGGVTFFIHRNAPKGYQGVRVRYGATALIGRSLYDLHAAVLKFLETLGCTIMKETVSRIDMQVTLGVDILSLLDPIYAGHAVSKSRDDVLYRNSGVKRTYLLGHRGRLELCIYDKSKELKKMAVSNPAKFQLMVDEHLGEDYSFDEPLTRVEFRLWRDVLRLMEINTIEDLRNRETSLAFFLTSKWFRVLAVPKSDVKGHEHETVVLDVWQRVQELFVCSFPGLGRPVQDISFNREKPITCDPVSLFKQAQGCLKTAMALTLGATSSVESVYAALFDWVDGMKYELFCGLNERAHKLKVVTGLRVASEQDIAAAKRRLEKWISQIKYERGRCFG